jgi:hypothetical protein
MKFLSLLILLCSLAYFTTAQENSASIKQQMSAIRKSTNWEDPVAAKKANEQIRELSKKLMMTGSPQGDLPKNLSKTEVEQAKKNAVDEKMKTWGQVMKSASGGEAADILLAEPVREEIKEDYRDDEAEGLNPAMLSECTTLILDFSVPFTQTLVSNMEMFTSIKNLVIIGVESIIPVDLNNILNKAKKYPLYELYIVGFEANLKKIPENIMLFPGLNILGVYGNQISVLPSNLMKMNNLKVLQLDYNPILTLLPLKELVKNLEELSIKNTEISQSEVANLKKMFPNCKIQAV